MADLIAPQIIDLSEVVPAKKVTIKVRYSEDKGIVFENHQEKPKKNDDGIVIKDEDGNFVKEGINISNGDAVLQPEGEVTWKPVTSDFNWIKIRAKTSDEKKIWSINPKRENKNDEQDWQGKIKAKDILDDEFPYERKFEWKYSVEYEPKRGASGEYDPIIRVNK